MSLKNLYQRMYCTDSGTPVPVVIIDILQGVLVLLNLGVGLYGILLRHHYFSGVSNVLVAVFLFGIHFWAMERRREYQERRRELQQLQERQQQLVAEREARLTERDSQKAYLAACINLQTVMNALGVVLRNGAVEFKKDGQVFRISAGYIERYTSKRAAWATTCYIGGPMPVPEKITTALILLNNNPQVFEKWCRQDGLYLQ